MKYTNIPLAYTVVALCKNAGVRQIVISPGSRNAPLILGFTADPYFECFSVVDERSAGFFALGLSQQSGIPTALVCSSGSAVVNYYPAVTEAYYSRIPLLVLSADRPPHMVDIGDGQTIRQDGVFGTHVGYSASLEQDVSHVPSKYPWPKGNNVPEAGIVSALQAELQLRNEQQIYTALNTAFREKLPVHLNVPMEEPLYGTLESPPVVLVPRPFVVEHSENTQTLPHELWAKAACKMVLIGSMPPGSLSESVLQMLAADASVVVFTETTSNVHHQDFFPSIDSILAPVALSTESDAYFEALRPDVLLTLGGMVVSKKIKQFLRKYQPRHHWHADVHLAYDTYFCLEQHYRCTPQTFLEGLTGITEPPKNANYRNYWAKIRDAYTLKRESYMKEIPFSDFKAFYHIFQSIPISAQIQLANSATVRYAQLFNVHPSNRVFCNRGTSGIEGSTSTAVGAAWNYTNQTVLISGDLGFLYDSNGLWNRNIRPDFRVIVINNSGGGIFRILPGYTENEIFTNYFETVHNHSLEAVCEHHGLNYYLAGSESELQQLLSTFFKDSGRPGLLEVQTPRALNNKILLGYFEYLNSIR